MHFHLNYKKTGNSIIFTGTKNIRKKLWYLAHLDTVSYLIQPKEQSRYPLVPFCHHMIQNGKRFAVAYRFVPSNSRYEIVARGCLESEDSHPFFRPESGDFNLKPGDRIVFSTSYQEDRLTGNFTADIDNAGGVAALLAAAPVLAAAKIEAMLAFPDEEEGPPGSGNQMIGRGSARILNLLPVPELVVVSDVQQTGGDSPRSPGGGEWVRNLGKERSYLNSRAWLGERSPLHTSTCWRSNSSPLLQESRRQDPVLEQFLYFSERRRQCDAKDSKYSAVGISGVQPAL